MLLEEQELSILNPILLNSLDVMFPLFILLFKEKKSNYEIVFNITTRISVSMISL
jgi:hypothetical protein